VGVCGCVWVCVGVCGCVWVCVGVCGWVGGSVGRWVVPYISYRTYTSYRTYRKCHIVSYRMYACTTVYIISYVQRVCVCLCVRMIVIVYYIICIPRSSCAGGCGKSAQPSPIREGNFGHSNYIKYINLYYNCFFCCALPG
jgi:hypothetical protein